MENNKNTSKFSPKTKNKIFLIVTLALLSIGVLCAFFRPKTAHADVNILDSNVFPVVYYAGVVHNPMSNGFIIFHDSDEEPPFEDNYAWTCHSYPLFLGGYRPNQTLPLRAIERHYNNNQGDPAYTILSDHMIYENGSETIRLNDYLNEAYPNIQENNPKEVITIGMPFCMKADIYAFFRYQLEIPKNTYSFTIKGELNYHNNIEYLDHTTTIISSDLSSNNYPLLYTDNTAYARVNIGSLVEQSVDFSIFKDYVYEVKNLSITLNLHKNLPTSASRVIYAKGSLADMRTYKTYTDDMYNKLHSNDDPVVTIFTPVEAFLKLEIFKGFTFGYLLLTVLGVSFFTLLMKVLKSS